MEDKSAILVTALLCLTVVEMYALSQGIDGTILILYASIMGGVLGVPIVEIARVLLGKKSE